MVNSAEFCFKCNGLFLYTFVNSLKHLYKHIKLSFEPELNLNLCQLSFTDT